MKKILTLIALALCMQQAQAVTYVNQQTWDSTPMSSRGLCMPNQAGGTIILFPGVKHNGAIRALVLSTTEGGQALQGTWDTLGQESVVVTWVNGSTSVFNNTAFRGCTF
jgi:hypothetical protein